MILTRHTEGTRRLAALRVELDRVALALRRQRARVQSYALAVAVEGESAELTTRYVSALAHATGLEQWLAQLRAAEAALALRVEPQTPERIAS